MHEFFRLKSYVNWWLLAKGVHSIHSPFLFRFYKEVVLENRPFYSFPILDTLIATVKADTTKGNYQPFGSKKGQVYSTTRGHLAQKFTKPKAIQEMLFRAVNFLQPKTIIELGTSLGLTTLYLASAKKEAKVYTFEGDTQSLKWAQDLFKEQKMNNVEAVLGDIDQTLPQILAEVAPDFVFIDANHTYQATLQYFEWMKSKAALNALLVFDDIYWSPDMARAWAQIKKDSASTLTLDFYHTGWVFLRKNQSPQHFKLKGPGQLLIPYWHF